MTYDEFDNLRKQFRTADEADFGERQRNYEMQRPSMPPGLYWRLRWLAGHVYRWIDSIGPWSTRHWPASLLSSSSPRNAQPLLVWAVQGDKETIASACVRVNALQERTPGFAPILITDLANFEYYSRLKWLVEYVPSIGGAGITYENRKLRYLARLYMFAPMVTVDEILDGSQDGSNLLDLELRQD